MADIDQKIISHFLCTHRLDSTKVDIDPHFTENNILLLPIRDQHTLKQIHGINMDQYVERIKILFDPYREKN